MPPQGATLAGLAEQPQAEEAEQPQAVEAEQPQAEVAEQRHLEVRLCRSRPAKGVVEEAVRCSSWWFPAEVIEGDARKTQMMHDE